MQGLYGPRLGPVIRAGPRGGPDRGTSGYRPRPLGGARTPGRGPCRTRRRPARTQRVGCAAGVYTADFFISSIEQLLDAADVTDALVVGIAVSSARRARDRSPRP